MRVVERVWEWHFAASPEISVADPRRYRPLQRGDRLPALHVDRHPDARRHRAPHRQRAALRLTLTWDEDVPRMDRRSPLLATGGGSTSGPLRSLTADIEFVPEDAAPMCASASAPRPGTGRARWRCAAGGINRLGPVLDRLFREGGALRRRRRARAWFRGAAAGYSAGGAAARRRARPHPRRAGICRRRAACRPSARIRRGRPRTDAAARAGPAMGSPTARGDRDLPRGGARGDAGAALGPRLPALPRRQDRGDEPRQVAAGRALPELQHRLRARLHAERRGHVSSRPPISARSGSAAIAWRARSPAPMSRSSRRWRPAAGIALEATLPDGDYRARTIEPGGSADFRGRGGEGAGDHARRRRPGSRAGPRRRHDLRPQRGAGRAHAGDRGPRAGPAMR